MNQISETQAPTKRRRHSIAFKAQVLEEINQPGTSIAAVARHHGLNANLVHKWRKSPALSRKLPGALPAFVEVETAKPLSDTPVPIILELPYHGTTMKIHWPASQVTALAHWLKVILN